MRQIELSTIPVLMSAALLSGWTAAAQEAVDPGAPEEAERTVHVVRQFDHYPLPVAPFGGPETATRDVSGRVVWSAFRVAQEDSSALAVVDSYRARLADHGFEAVFDCVNETCGGLTFRFEAALLPAPEMLVDAADFAQLSMSRASAPSDDAESGQDYVSVLVSRVLGIIYVQTVVVTPAFPEVTIIDSPNVENDGSSVFLPRDDKAFFDALMAAGHLPIEGLQFETGGSTLSPSSDAALDLLGRLLARNGDVRIAIVGHSDNQGSLESNIALSKSRAEAVREALIARSVPQSQIEAHGVGWLVPVASNATEEGRGQNRRVELVVVSAPAQ